MVVLFPAMLAILSSLIPSLLLMVVVALWQAFRTEAIIARYKRETPLWWTLPPPILDEATGRLVQPENPPPPPLDILPMI